MTGEYHQSDMAQRLLYQVTLASGRIVTRPEEFGEQGESSIGENYYRPVFAEDGRLLTVAADAARRQRQLEHDQPLEHA